MAFLLVDVVIVLGAVAMLRADGGGPATPSVDIAIADVDGREVVVVPYTHEADGFVGRLRWIIGRETTSRVAAIDLGTGEHLWDTVISADLPPVEGSAVAAGAAYAYVATDDGLVILDMDDGDIVARDDDIDGLGDAYLASRTAYAYDRAEHLVVTLASSGEVLALPLDEPVARPAPDAVAARWRDRLNLDDGPGGSVNVTSKTAPAPDGSTLSLNTWPDRHRFFVLDAMAEPVRAAGSDHGFLVIETLDSSSLAVADRTTFEPIHTYRLPETASLDQATTTPSGRVVMLTEEDEGSGVLLTATADGFVEYPIGDPGLLWF